MRPFLLLLLLEPLVLEAAASNCPASPTQTSGYMQYYLQVGNAGARSI